jgi:hypothetical protein
VFFVGNSSGEINSVAEDQQIPQPIKLEGSAIGSVDRSQEGAGRGIIIIDYSVAKISDPQLVAFYQSKPPWGVEMALGNETPDKFAAGIEDVYKTVTRPGYIVFFLGVLQCVGNEDFTADVANAKGCVAGRKSRINKAGGVHLLKVFVVGLDSASVEVRHLKKIVTTGDAQSRAFVNRPFAALVRPVVYRDDRVGSIKCGVPTRNGTVFADKDE